MACKWEQLKHANAYSPCLFYFHKNPHIWENENRLGLYCPWIHEKMGLRTISMPGVEDRVLVLGATNRQLKDSRIPPHMAFRETQNTGYIPTCLGSFLKKRVRHMFANCPGMCM